MFSKLVRKLYHKTSVMKTPMVPPLSTSIQLKGSRHIIIWKIDGCIEFPIMHFINSALFFSNHTGLDFLLPSPALFILRKKGKKGVSLFSLWRLKVNGYKSLPEPIKCFTVKKNHIGIAWSIHTGIDTKKQTNFILLFFIKIQFLIQQYFIPWN